MFVLGVPGQARRPGSNEVGSKTPIRLYNRYARVRRLRGEWRESEKVRGMRREGVRSVGEKRAMMVRRGWEKGWGERGGWVWVAGGRSFLVISFILVSFFVVSWKKRRQVRSVGEEEGWRERERVRRGGESAALIWSRKCSEHYGTSVCGGHRLGDHDCWRQHAWVHRLRGVGDGGKNKLYRGYV